MSARKEAREVLFALQARKEGECSHVHFSWCPFGAKKVAREEYGKYKHEGKVSTSKKVIKQKYRPIYIIYITYDSIFKNKRFSVCSIF